jgi:hypothetical protein
MTEFSLNLLKHTFYSARRLIGSRIIESAAYCNQKFLALLYRNVTSFGYFITFVLALSDSIFLVGTVLF